jgi:hypothetical protein
MGVHGDAADSAPVSRSRSPSLTNEPLELFLGRERFLLPFSDVFSKTSERIGRDRKESGRGRRQLTYAPLRVANRVFRSSFRALQ